MNKIARLIILTFLAVSTTIRNAEVQQQQQQKQQTKFEKEKLYYKIKFKDFFDIVVGEMNFSCDSSMLNEKEIYVAECAIKAKNFDFLNYFKSYIDKEKMLPLACEEEFVEKEKESYSVVFDYNARKAIINDKIKNLQTEKEMGEKIQDTVSIFYWLRSEKLEEGKQIETSFYNRNKIYDTKFIAEKNEDKWIIKNVGEKQKFNLDSIIFNSEKIPIEINFSLKIGRFSAEKKDL